MEHLKFCLKEILIIRSLLNIKNSSFFKRNLGRYIALRVDDFIKLAFALNKSTINVKHVKDDLNALQDLYREFFKTQRDKYGAHFQELEFSKRLEIWSQIDFQKADFFTELPIDIYGKFHSVPGFIETNTLYENISVVVSSEISELNEKLDIEKYPNFSSDILSLTRYNSGGIINFSHLHTKAGTLKALELILNYNIELFKLVKDHNELASVIKKLIVIDLSSYCDNFITRTDIPIGAKQEEDGLDQYITESELPNAFKIITDFKNNFRFQDQLDEIRLVRNTICGHIDTSISISDFKVTLDSLQFEKIISFYQHIRNTFKQMCHQEFLLTMHLMEPENSRAYSIQQLVGMEVKPFDKDSIPETVFLQNDVDDINNYTMFFNNLSHPGKHEEARHFFWDCFGQSAKLETKPYIRQANGVEIGESIDFRKGHEYFEDKLFDPYTSVNDKIKIIQLFVECRSGYPRTLLYILLNTYRVNSIDVRLNTKYLQSFGELSNEMDDKIFEILQVGCMNNNFELSYYSLLSIFKIDIKSRQKISLNINTNDTFYSDFIKKMILDAKNDFVKISYCIALESEIYFSPELSRFHKSLNKIYNDFFASVFKSSLRKHLTPLLKLPVDHHKFNNIIKAFKAYRFATLIGLLSEFLELKKQFQLSRNFRWLLYIGIIKFSEIDNTETHNFGVVNFQLNDIERAVIIAEHLVKVNPSNSDYYYSLLSLYLKNEKYLVKFLNTQKYVLENLKLSEEKKKEFEILNY